MTEKKLMDIIHKQFPDAALFRNDNGVAYSGEVVKLTGGRVLIKNAKTITYGLQKGSADLVGWRPVTITPDMVGQTVAVFMSVEVKTKTDHYDPDGAQGNWARAVQRDGGIAMVLREHEDGTIPMEF